MLDDIINPDHWTAVPFHYWSVVFFIFGSVVGSLLNVCIHRIPREQSIVHPRSHCPACGYMIPWHQNIPLYSWLALGGRCANCQGTISPRYFLVELLTAVAFLSCWLRFGAESPWLAMAYCVLLSGFIAATLIDFEHFIIPDVFTLGGMGAGILLSLLIPQLHAVGTIREGVLQSALGLAVGGGTVYALLWIGKWMFGRKTVQLAPGSRVTFSETALHFDREKIPYEDLFYHASDTITLEARTVELVDRCYHDVPVRLNSKQLVIGDEQLSPEEVHYLRATTKSITLPREAMGLGDVKFMGAIGAFLGWHGALFALMFSSIIGSIVGLTLIGIGRRKWSTYLPYGPYIAVAATAWIFLDPSLQEMWRELLDVYVRLVPGGAEPGF